MENFYDQIDQYLNGTLNEKEHAAFEKQLQEDEGLQKEVQLHESIFSQLKTHYQVEAEEPAFREAVQVIGKAYLSESETDQPPIKLSNRRNYFIGIALATAATILLLLWAPWQRNLYDRFANHPEANFSEMSDAQNLLAEAGTAFNDKNYQEAIELLNPYTDQNPKDIQALLFLGIAQLENGSLVKAESNFNKISKGNTTYQYDGLWYLALLKLKQQDLEGAKSYIQQIPEGSRVFKKAQELKKAL